MPWFSVDDGFWGHPKVDGLPLAAVGLWALAGSWSCRYLTDGRVPEARVAKLGGMKSDAEALVAAGLWEVVEGGYMFHDWEHAQTSKADVEAKRALNRVEQRQSRDRRRKSLEDPGMSALTQSLTQTVVSALSTPPSLPFPSLPVPDPIPDQKRGESACVAAPPRASEPVRVELPDAAPRQHRTQPSSVHWQEVHSGWAAAWEEGGHGTPPRPSGTAREAAIEFARDVAARASVDLYTAAKAIGVAALRLPPSKRLWGLAECDPYATTKEAPRDPSFARLMSAVPKFLTVAEMAAEGRSK